MDLYIYPEAASKRDGYGIGVDFAYRKETPKEDDVVVWLSSYDRSDMLHVRPQDYVIKRKSLFSASSIWNLVKGRNPSELTVNDLAFLREFDFDTIHCDEVIFYRALRRLFPEKHLRIRLHNCFSRIGVRNEFLKRSIGEKYRYSIKVMTSVEKEIFNDRNVYKIFISNEDRDFYRATYGIVSDSETWQYSPDLNKMNESREPISLSNKLTWYGGVEAHKASSVQWFIESVLPIIQESNPNVEFHLWGKNTERYYSPSKKVFGHGFYNGDGMPLQNSLYVNPDIIGGGIKLKLMTLMEKGIPFVSTTFGFEGYESSLMDDNYCVVVEENKMAETIVSMLDKYKFIAKE